MPLATALTYKRHKDRLAAPASQNLAVEILGLVMRHRRVARDSKACAHHRCAVCVSPHLHQLKVAIENHEPITFVLPAFPGKSPNPAKVLGPRLDMAERQSLAFLDTLCHQIREIYPPGARIILCSDGRVFSDVVGIKEADISTYHQDLVALISQLDTENLDTFNLDDVFSDCDFDEMRSKLMSGYGEPLETLRTAVRAGGDARRMYCGITRFLFEDALRPGVTTSKTALQKDARRRAYKVIQRSRAWDGLLAQCFPNAVRLSIHPQACGSRKIGIHLMETTEEWLTPWHSVAVEVKGKFRLMKHAHVKRLDADLVFQDGRPSHYVLKGLPKEVQWR